MKLKDFLTLKVGSGVLVSGTSYNPLINYDWSTTTTSGLRYIKDIGSTPTYNASMYFGRGVYFNGVDQYISITPINLSGDFTIKIDLQNDKSLTNRTVVGSNLNTDYIKINGSDIITKIGGVYRSFPMRSVLIAGTKYCFRVERLNGTVSMWLNDDKLITSFTENSNLILDSIGGTGGGAHFNGVFKDLFIFKRTLTQSEITQSYEQPEEFYAMAQADSTCVLNMPMCETDKYVRNMKNYTIGSTNLFTSGFSVSTNPTITNITNGYRIVKTSSGSVTWIALTNTAPVAETIVKIRFNFTLVAGSVYPTITATYTSEGSNILSTPYQVKEGYNELVVQSWVNTRLAYLQINSITSTFTWDFTNIIVNALSGIYTVANYTSSVRDNAKNLQYGLQTCKFVRDSLGVIQSASNYLECDGVGYGNTGKYIDSLTDFSMEFIGLFKTSSTEQAHGVGYYNTYNRVTFSINSSGKLFSRCGGTIFQYSSVSLFDVSNYLTLTFVQSTKIFKLYLNGKYVGQVSNANFISTGGDYTMGAQGSTTYAVNGDIRLFKVHNKVLTQEEVIKNYNSYVAKGLLT